MYQVGQHIHSILIVWHKFFNMFRRRKTLFFFSLIFIFNSYYLNAQKKQIKIDYALKIAREKDLFKNNTYLKESYEKSINNIQPIIFSLVINNVGSIFYFNSNLSMADDHISEFSRLLASYTGEVYNIKNDTILKQNQFLKKNVLVIEKKKTDWVLTDETKMIDTYLCYKATNEYIVDNGFKVFRHPVVAWYCPNLPYNYGPNGYGNLPGLILELQVRNASYGVSKITFDDDSKINFDFIKKATIITEQELDEKLKKMNDFDSIKK